MRLNSLIGKGITPFGKPFIKEENDVQSVKKHVLDEVWQEIAIKHNPLSEAVKYIMGPITEEQYQEVVSDMKYRLEQITMALDR